MRDLVEVLFRNIPAGVGSKGSVRLSRNDFRDIILLGAGWAVRNGFGTDDDLEHTESRGCIDGADPDLISKKAYERGMAQQGTLGSGNHFTEIQYVDEVFDKTAARDLGLFHHQITVMIHTGSRGFGHQVCTDFLEVMQKAVRKYKIDLPDRELACAPYNSSEASDYLGAMRAAANYAWANRQCISHLVSESFARVFNSNRESLGINLLYDVAHNIAKIEEHVVNDTSTKLIVHRKGATRAFPPGHLELPDDYRLLGQPVIIPGDMGRASYVLLGTERGMKDSFGSTCHGAGRVMSRHRAVKTARGRSIAREMEEQGIIVRAAGRGTIAEEMPEAYKDVTDVVNVVHKAGLSRKVAKLRPLAVIKG